MRCVIIVAIITTLTGCREVSKDPLSTEIRILLISATYTVDIPDQEFAVLLWQRSYPDEYLKLVEQAKAPEDPFASHVETSLDQLTPSDFGIEGWGRGLVPRVFDELGHSFQDTKGAEASWDLESSIFLVTHSPEAIKAFEGRFPELKREKKAEKLTPHRS